VRARERVGALAGVEALASSRLYATAPVGPPQPDYLNAAILVECTQEPAALLQALLSIEAELGRVRAERWGPRVIDLDVLWGPGLVVDEPALVVPHPRLTERDFALLPLLDVAPDARDPRTGARYAARGDAGISVVAPAW